MLLFIMDFLKNLKEYLKIELFCYRINLPKNGKNIIYFSDSYFRKKPLKKNIILNGLK